MARVADGDARYSGCWGVTTVAGGAALVVALVGDLVVSFAVTRTQHIEPDGIVVKKQIIKKE